MNHINKPKVFIILGPQGSGKTTQAVYLSNALGWQYFSMGYYTRKIQSQKSQIGKLSHKYYLKGKLFPTYLIESIIRLALKDYDLSKGIVFEGFPRTIRQNILFEKILKQNNIDQPYVIYLDIPKEMVYKRLASRKICAICAKPVSFEENMNFKKTCSKCGGKLVIRLDDNPEIIRERVALFYREIKHVINHYRSIKRLIKIDGTPNIKKVSSLMFDQLTKLKLI